MIQEIDDFPVHNLRLPRRSKAVNGISFKYLSRRIRFSLLSSDGSGKTTIFNLINGVYKPDGGKILLDGENLVGHTQSIAGGGLPDISKHRIIFKCNRHI